ncbi:MAG: triphosphoribosyl-dephospho-CoA synthase [Gammaproteobacteria bacterium]
MIPALRFNNPVADAVWGACVTELQALKPGNVGLHAPGHGMDVADFIASARCTAEVLGAPGLTVGERIYRSITATQAAVGCNTNLGIVLLCAPLAHSALWTSPASLRQKLHAVLAGLDQTDAEQAFAAIRLANPAGLGSSTMHDVQQSPTTGLQHAMCAAANRDRIAYQYAFDFDDIFAIGLPALAAYINRGWTAAWAAVGVYFTFLSGFADTHIQRKLGVQIAEQVRMESDHWFRILRDSAQPEPLIEPLMAFDASLKQRGINPGTSADLTVATLLADCLQALENGDFNHLAFFTGKAGDLQTMDTRVG